MKELVELEEVRAVLRYVRISPQKVRKLVDAVKGKKVELAVSVLKHMPNKAAIILQKLVNSAVANAQQTSIELDSLSVNNILVNQGPVLKRFRARARGRGTRILKRTSHITVVLTGELAN